jgi:O-antigen/teichoic acid export membrane protein
MVIRTLLRLARNREAVTVIVFSVVGAFGSLFANRLLTEVTGPAELGTLYLYLNLVLWITLPATSSYLFVVHHWPVALQNGRAHWFAHKMYWGLFFQAVVAFVVCSSFCYSGRFGIVDWKTAGLVALIALGQGCFQIFYSVPGAERRRVTSGLLDWANTFARPLFLGLGVLLLGGATVGSLLKTHAVYSGLVGLAALSCFVFLVQQKPKGQPKKDKSVFLSWRGYGNFFAPAMMGAVVAQIAASAERWGLATRSDASSTALFVQATGLCIAAAGGVNSILMSYFYPIINQHAAESDSAPLAKAWRPVMRFLKLSFILFALMGVVGWFFGRWLTPLFFGERFFAASEILPIVFVASAILGFTQTMTIPVFAARDATSPNLARAVSLGLYAAALILCPADHSNPVSYAWIYLVSQVGYLALVAAAFLVHARRVQRGVQ